MPDRSTVFRHLRLLPFAAAALLVLCGTNINAQTGTSPANDLPNPCVTTAPWSTLPAGRTARDSIAIRDGMIYVADSESNGVAPHPGGKRGIRIGRISDGVALYRIPDPLELKGTSAAEGVAVDARGNVYGGEISGAQYFAALRTMLEIDLTDAEFTDGWSSILRGVIPGADTLLATLAATTPVYIFSNTNALHFEHWGVDYPALLASVTQVFCSHHIGLRKPAAAAFNKVCVLMNTAPERVAFFDDLPENVAGAHRCGLHAFQVTALDGIRHALAHGIMLPAALP